jgi:hypothetical protein
MFGFLPTVVRLTQEEYKIELAAREAKRTSRTTTHQNDQ